jgi:membrane protease YdiL (CAAX protease family)
MAMTDTGPTPLKRALSLAELALGTFIVIGHNVFHVVPNEVPILFVLGWLSLRLRDGGLVAAGIEPPARRWRRALFALVPAILKPPKSWWMTLLFAVVTAVLLQADSIVTDPIADFFWHRQADLSSFKPLVGNLKFAAESLAIIWTFAAFGEEISYRGYLMQRAADLGDNSRLAWWIAALYVAVLFGFGHTFKGPAGVFDSAVSGAILASAYLLSGRNLWVAIIAHGLSDTFAVAAVFSGLAGV